MKTTVVPAQVTTIEDRIAGSLGLSQLMLLAAPIFGGSALFAILPPGLHSAAYKLVLIGLLFLVCCLLAIRIKGTILLLWLVVMLRYALRPRYYVYDKRSLHGREEYRDTPTSEPDDAPMTVPQPGGKPFALSTAELVALQTVMDNPAVKLAFETTKKGNLYVRITEIKQEG